MYESKNEPLLPTKHFRKRLLMHILYATILVLITVLIGVSAHLFFEDISWHDALLNTAFIIAGLGAFVMPATVGGKVFFAVYGLVVGLVFLATLATIFAPVAHRLIHKFHLDEDE